MAMTPHGSSTSSTTSIPTPRNPYEELAPSDLPPAGEPSHNPYDELSIDPGPPHRPEGTRPDAPHGRSPGENPDAPSAGDGYGGYDGPGLLGHSVRLDPDESDDPDEPGLPDYSERQERMLRARAVRRRRRSRLRLFVKLVIGCGVLLAFLFVGDRWAALYAEDQTAEKVQESLDLHGKPEVHIRGFPFVTQLANERLDTVDISVSDMPAGRISVAQVNGTVNDVEIVGDAPTSIKGAVLGEMRGEVVLDFDDLDRELGTSQVKFSEGGPNTVLADGKLPVADRQVLVRARAHVQRTGDSAVGTTVDNMRLRVPGLFQYTPGKNGGLRLARPVAERVQKDAEKARALFEVKAVSDRFGLTPERAKRIQRSEGELNRVTGGPKFVDELMQINMLDVALENPSVMKEVGVDPALVSSLQKLRQPELEDKLSLSVKLPDMPGDVRLRGVSVVEDGIRAEVTGSGIPFGDAAE